MKPFKGPRKQGGWIAIAAMVVGGIASSYGEQKKEDKAGKRNYADQRDLDDLNFQQQAWLAEQGHKWNLEDYERTQNYKEDAIGGFRDAAPANALTADGSWSAPPERTQVDTSNLARTQENGQAMIIDPRTGQPVNSNAAPMSQFARAG